jgi:hypothetical protein
VDVFRGIIYLLALLSCSPSLSARGKLSFSRMTMMVDWTANEFGRGLVLGHSDRSLSVTGARSCDVGLQNMDMGEDNVWVNVTEERSDTR